MIKEHSGEFHATCNGPGCGVTVSADAVDFKDFIAYIKSQGWKIKKVNDNWEHFCCQDCADMPF
jgi:hypothetical protein